VAKIRPIGDRVVVKAAAKKKLPRVGIVIPDTCQGETPEGTVIAVGTGACLTMAIAPHYVREGDRILSPSNGGTEFKLDDEEYSCSKKMTSWRHWLAQLINSKRKDYFVAKNWYSTMSSVVRSRKASTLWPKRSKRPRPQGAQCRPDRNLAHRP